MNTHTNIHPHKAEIVPPVKAGPRTAGRPGKHAPKHLAERTLNRDGQPDRLFTLPEVLALTGVARSTWDRWRERGKTPPCATYPNRTIRVWESDLVRWHHSLEND